MKFRFFEQSDTAEVKRMIREYYREDHPGQEMRDEQIQKTLDELLRHPEKGGVVVLLQEAELVGYAILIYFWSNELGGDIVNVDELFVRKDYRGRGIGSDFLSALIQNRFHDCVGLELGTTPQNEAARRLYAKLGFVEDEAFHMCYRF